MAKVRRKPAANGNAPPTNKKKAGKNKKIVKVKAGGVKKKALVTKSGIKKAKAMAGGAAKDGKKAKDARLKLLARPNADARDLLVMKTKTSVKDARQKLEAIRGYKTTSNGSFTIKKTKKGKLVLTTNKNKAPETQQPKPRNRPADRRRPAAGPPAVPRSPPRVNRTSGMVSKGAARRSGGGAGPRGGNRQVGQRTNPRSVVSGGGGNRRMTAADMLDQELMRTRVDRGAMQRTIRQQQQGSNRRRSSPPARYVPTRTLPPASPRRHSYGGGRPRSPIPRSPERYDRHAFDGRNVKQEDRVFSRLDSGPSGVSPLEGAKIVVANLQTSVSQEDITELFGDVGALKRAKIREPGVAEVVFVNRSDAVRAVEIYHNRQLDGKAMKCHTVSR